MRRLLPSPSLALASVARPRRPGLRPGLVQPEHVARQQHPLQGAGRGRSENYGTDIEFASSAASATRSAGSYYNGLQIVDITKPSRTRRVSGLRLPDPPGRRPGLQGRRRHQADAGDVHRRLGERPRPTAAASRTPGEGLLRHADRRQRQAGHVHRRRDEPEKPKTRLVRRGPAGLAQHDRAPQRRVPLQLELGPDHVDAPAIEIIDIRNPAKPTKHRRARADRAARPRHRVARHHVQRRRHARLLRRPLARRRDRHDEPGKPTILTEFDDESINVWHQSDPVTIQTSEGPKTFLIAEDEFAGAAGGPVCPSGGVHVYDITGEKERAPEKVGYWNIDDFGRRTTPRARAPRTSSTSTRTSSS